ncbi:hypothetical protein B0O99DRAFT_594853 [Bisporella sp. PMI_857]|nr:hypothetical protein B0O99DRAFT_594853 [Bisporella sp. PMI_857]
MNSNSGVGDIAWSDYKFLPRVRPHYKQSVPKSNQIAPANAAATFSSTQPPTSVTFTTNKPGKHSTSDKVALGIRTGLGLPALLVAIIGVWTIPSSKVVVIAAAHPSYESRSKVLISKTKGLGPLPPVASPTPFSLVLDKSIEK